MALRGGLLPAFWFSWARSPATVAVHLQDVDVVGETVQQRSGQALRPEHLGPFVEGQVGGDQDGAPLVALAEDLEEEFRAGGGQGDEAQFVDDQQVQARALSLVGDRGTKPSSSMISRPRRDSWRWWLRRRLSSRASMSSWTKAAAVVKPTDNPR